MNRNVKHFRFQLSWVLNPDQHGDQLRVLCGRDRPHVSVAFRFDWNTIIYQSPLEAEPPEFVFNFTCRTSCLRRQFLGLRSTYYRTAQSMGLVRLIFLQFTNYFWNSPFNQVATIKRFSPIRKLPKKNSSVKVFFKSFCLLCLVILFSYKYFLLLLESRATIFQMEMRFEFTRWFFHLKIFVTIFYHTSREPC